LASKLTRDEKSDYRLTADEGGNDRSNEKRPNGLGQSLPFLPALVAFLFLPKRTLVRVPKDCTLAALYKSIKMQKFGLEVESHARNLVISNSAFSSKGKIAIVIVGTSADSAV
jgi:hypothetical protein